MGTLQLDIRVRSSALQVFQLEVHEKSDEDI